MIGHPDQRSSRYRSCALLAHLSTQPITIGNVQLLQLFEPQQQRYRLRRVMPIAYKPGDELALACDMSLAHRHVPFGLRQVLLDRVAVRGRRTHRERRAIGFGDATIEGKDGIVLSFL